MLFYLRVVRVVAGNLCCWGSLENVLFGKTKTHFLPGRRAETNPPNPQTPQIRQRAGPYS